MCITTVNTLQTHSGTRSSQRYPGFPTLECLTSRPPLRSVPLVLVSVIHTPPSSPLVSSQWAVDTNLLPAMTRSMSAVSKRRDRERELRCDKQERGRFPCYIPLGLSSIPLHPSLPPSLPPPPPSHTHTHPFPCQW